MNIPPWQRMEIHFYGNWRARPAPALFIQILSLCCVCVQNTFNCVKNTHARRRQSRKKRSAPQLVNFLYSKPYCFLSCVSDSAAGLQFSALQQLLRRSEQGPGHSGRVLAAPGKKRLFPSPLCTNKPLRCGIIQPWRRFYYF